MNLRLDELIQRSKTPFESAQGKVLCKNEDSPLVEVKEHPKLKLDPIWMNQVDDHEGRLYADYIKSNPSYNSLYLREAVANRLYKAAELLPNHLQLVLRAGHRPMAVQRREFQAMLDKYFQQNPEGTREESLLFARTYICDPDVSLPAHCCGAAVDVDVFDIKENRLADFGCSVNTNSEIAALHSTKVTEKQHDMRMILLKAMLGAGFAPDYDEWWHYNYGATGWAHFYNHPASLYGII